MYYVYVLQSKKDRSLYIGYTNDLKRRFEEHNKKLSRSTKFKTPFQLVYYEAYQSRADARYREDNLKRYSGAYTHLRRRIKNSVADDHPK